MKRGVESGEGGERVSGKTRRYVRRVPMEGEGRREGRAVVRRWDSSRRVQVGQVYIWRCGGRGEVGEVGKSSSLGGGLAGCFWRQVGSVMDWG
jgi:hypothetical protein